MTTITSLGEIARPDRPGSHVRPHILRHTFASRAYQRGVPPQRVQKWLGHASITTTERYAHLAEEAGDALIDALDEPDLTEIEGEDL